MNHIEGIVNGIHRLEDVLAPENLELYYDPKIFDGSSNLTKEVASTIIPLMPVIDGEVPSIPVCDHQTKPDYYLGILCARSLLGGLGGLEVVRLCPIDTAHRYPSRILSLFGSRVEYPPITGFLSVHRNASKGVDVALLAGKDYNNPDLIELPKRRGGKGTVARVVAETCRVARFMGECKITV